MLSIVIVSWNTAKTTLACLKSIKTHLKRLKPEIIVVDNNSSDNTVSLLKKEKDIKLIVNPNNFGFAKANNIGANVAQGDFLLFLNSDIKLVDDSPLKMLNFLKKQPQVAIIGPQFLNPDHSPQASVFPPQTIKNAIRHFWLHQKSFLKYNPKTKKPLPVWAISGGAFLIRKKLFDQLGGWDPRYFIYFEDLELCRQVRKIGKKIFFFPQSQVVHYHGLSGKKLADPRNQWRRLVKSSIIYHGPIKHFLINFLIKTSQQWSKLKRAFP